jgi:hypothetical protein
MPALVNLGAQCHEPNLLIRAILAWWHSRSHFTPPWFICPVLSLLYSIIRFRADECAGFRARITPVPAGEGLLNATPNISARE